MANQRTRKPSSPEDDGLEANAQKFADLYEQGVMATPYEWRGALVDVLDTYEVCARKVVATRGDLDAFAAVQLTSMVLDRKKWLEEKDAQEEAARFAE